MKIAIIGPGAVGTAIALVLDTLDVTLLGRQDKVMTFEERDTGERKSIPVKSFMRSNAFSFSAS